jgi:Periplasmic binding protein-like domain
VAARGRQVHVPRELSIVGFDDLDWTTLVDPPLTVVAQDQPRWVASPPNGYSCASTANQVAAGGSWLTPR